MSRLKIISIKSYCPNTAVIGTHTGPIALSGPLTKVDDDLKKNEKSKIKHWPVRSKTSNELCLHNFLERFNLIAAVYWSLRLKSEKIIWSRYKRRDIYCSLNAVSSKKLRLCKHLGQRGRNWKLELNLNNWNYKCQSNFTHITTQPPQTACLVVFVSWR